jgi:phenylpropionate dioxygenase-like ring-hydroxylating dioxygenase large terminal subunit
MEFDSTLIAQFWHLVGHRSEFARSGDFIRFQTVVGDIVVFNDGKSVVAFDNLCPHRGARIFGAPYGNSPATCPYHGWTHRAGRIFVARKERFSECDTQGASLNFLQTEWLGDFLFVSIEPRTSLAQQLGDLGTRLIEISANINGRQDFDSYKYDCYWPIAVENALEPYHIDLIHPKTLGLLNIGDGENVYFGYNSVWQAPILEPRSEKILKSLNKFFNISNQYQGYEFIYLFPFSMISSTFGYSYSIQNFIPINNNETSFYSRLFTSRVRDAAAQRALSSFFASTADINRQVFTEDHDVCKLVPTQSWSMQPLRFAADNEAKIQHFREACRAHWENQIGHLNYETYDGLYQSPRTRFVVRR